jgi:hypothetical protein
VLKLARLTAQVAVIGVITAALLEGVVAFSLRNPRLSLLPMPLLRYLHERFDRNTIQVMPECATYDERVTYRLKPGRCTFANREFRNEFSINRMGVRDDDASLSGPETIVLGDSVTMGWGVEQAECYPAVFERLTGRRTLNAGVSSFGTVRALTFFDRFDHTGLRTVVLQYSDNDYVENRHFLYDAHFKVMSREEYDRTVTEHQRALSYFPGKYALNVLVQLQSLLRRQVSGSAVHAAQPPPTWEQQAEVFVEVLERFRSQLQPYQLVILTLDGEFARALQQRLAQPSWMSRALVLDVSHVAELPGAVYLLDGHPTAVGQRAIGEALARLLQSHD